MAINILITVVGIFLTITVESFFVSLLSFSVAVIVFLVLINKVNWKYWILITLFLTIFIDIILHRPLGITMLVTSVTVAILNLLFLVIPQKENLLSYLPYLFSVFIYYLLLVLLPTFFQDGVWGEISLRIVLISLVKSTITLFLIYAINILTSNFRANRDLKL
jgi:hypothetical protein